jgi:hypothetical protein
MYVFVRRLRWKRRKGRFDERRVGSIFGGGSAQEVRKLKGARVPPRSKPSGGVKGHGFYVGSKPLERR